MATAKLKTSDLQPKEQKTAYVGAPPRDEQNYEMQDGRVQFGLQEENGSNDNYSNGNSKLYNGNENGLGGGGGVGGGGHYIPPHERMNKRSDQHHHDMNGNNSDNINANNHETPNPAQLHNESPPRNPPATATTTTTTGYVPPHLRAIRAQETHPEEAGISSTSPPVNSTLEVQQGDRRNTMNNNGEKEELFLKSVSERVNFFKQKSIVFSPNNVVRKSIKQAEAVQEQTPNPTTLTTSPDNTQIPPQIPSDVSPPLHQSQFQQNGMVDKIEEHGDIFLQNQKNKINVNIEVEDDNLEEDGYKTPTGAPTEEDPEPTYQDVENFDLNSKEGHGEEEAEDAAVEEVEVVIPNTEEECTQKEDQNQFYGGVGEPEFHQPPPPPPPPPPAMENNFSAYIPQETISYSPQETSVPQPPSPPAVPTQPQRITDLPEQFAEDVKSGGVAQQLEKQVTQPHPPAYNIAQNLPDTINDEPVPSGGNSTNEVANGNISKKVPEQETTSAQRPSSNSSSTSLPNTVQSVPPYHPPQNQHSQSRRTQSVGKPLNASPSPNLSPMYVSTPHHPGVHVPYPPHAMPPMQPGPGGVQFFPRMVAPGPGPHVYPQGGYVMIQQHPQMPSHYAVVQHPQAQVRPVLSTMPQRMSHPYMYQPPRPPFARPPFGPPPDMDQHQHMSAPRPPSPAFVKHDIRYAHPAHAQQQQMNQHQHQPPYLPNTSNSIPHPPPQPSPPHSMYPAFGHGDNGPNSRGGEGGSFGGGAPIPPPPQPPHTRNQSPFQQHHVGSYDGGDTVSESESQRSNERMNRVGPRQGPGRTFGGRGDYPGRTMGRGPGRGRYDPLGRHGSAPPNTFEKQSFSPTYPPRPPMTQMPPQQYPQRVSSFPTTVQNLPYIPPPTQPLSPQPRTPREGFTHTPPPPMPNAMPPGGDFPGGPPMFMPGPGPMASMPQRPPIPQHRGQMFDDHNGLPPFAVGGPGVGVGIPPGGPMPPGQLHPHQHNMMLMHQQQQQQMQQQQQQQHQRQQQYLQMQTAPNYNSGFQGNDQVGKQDE